MVFDTDLANNGRSHAPEIAIDVNFADVSHPCDVAIENIVHWVQERFGAVQLVKAKDEFFAKTGKVFHDEEHYHRRMSYFIDFFVFQRPLESPAFTYEGITPHDAYLAEFPGQEPIMFRHSLFRVNRKQKDKLVLKDLFSNKLVLISSRPSESFLGVEKGHLLQGFVYSVGMENLLSRGVLFHSDSALPFLKKAIKILKKVGNHSEVKFLAHTASCQLRQFRLAHIESKHIYKDLLGQLG